MTSHADTLRRAAALLREHAEAATPGPWTIDGDIQAVKAKGGTTIAYDDECEMGDGRFIALMHPPVALALADLLDMIAHPYETDAEFSLVPERALAVARAVLRESEERR